MKKDKFGDLEQLPTEWPRVFEFYWCGHFLERRDIQDVAPELIKAAEDFIRATLKLTPMANRDIKEKARKVGVRPNALLLASRNLKIRYDSLQSSSEGWVWHLP
jgi:hypothetical protein